MKDARKEAEADSREWRSRKATEAADEAEKAQDERRKRKETANETAHERRFMEASEEIAQDRDRAKSGGDPDAKPEQGIAGTISKGRDADTEKVGASVEANPDSDKSLDEHYQDQKGLYEMFTKPSLGDNAPSFDEWLKQQHGTGQSESGTASQGQVREQDGAAVGANRNTDFDTWIAKANEDYQASNPKALEQEQQRQRSQKHDVDVN